MGASAGLIAGGLLVQYANWHWIFFVNLPVGVAAWLAAWRVLPADQGLGLRAGADWPGAGLVTGGVMLAVLAIASPADWWTGLVAVALLAAFAARQAAARTPLLPPRVLASRNVIGANLAQLLIIGAAMGFQIIVTLYLQRALRFGPAAAGLGFAPTAVVIAVVSLGLSARLTARFGARRLLLAGLVMITAALALLTQVPAHAAYVTDLLPVFVLFGIGGGLTLPAVTTLGMSGATDADAGVLSGVFNTVQQVGGALGLAALTALAASRTGGGTSAQALTSGYHLAWAAGAILGGASIAVAAIALRERRPSATDTMTDSDASLPDLASCASGRRSGPGTGQGSGGAAQPAGLSAPWRLRCRWFATLTWLAQRTQQKWRRPLREVSMNATPHPARSHTRSQAPAPPSITCASPAAVSARTRAARPVMTGA